MQAIKSKSVNIIGAGLSGLAASCLLAQAGFDVKVFEKNSKPGGRANFFEEDGFKFDMGPSWYWLPDVFENFFKQFNKTVSDYYDLRKLDTSYRVYWQKEDFTDIPAGMDKFLELAEDIEPGSGLRLKDFFAEAEKKYDIAVNDICREPGLSPFEFLKLKYLKAFLTCDSLSSVRSHIGKFVKDERLRQILEFPMLFLGTAANHTIALYSFMNHADTALSTWFPMGGIHEIPRGIQSLAESLGVKFYFNTEITAYDSSQGLIKTEDEQDFVSDILLVNADYGYFEQNILAKQDRVYDQNYWKSRTLCPSVLVFYLGVNKKLESLQHHNIFFDYPYDINAHEIYNEPQWPSKPFIYISAASKTDPSLAPENSENLFISIPIAAGLEDTEEIRNKHRTKILNRIEDIIGEEFIDNIVFERSYCIKDFQADYHSYQGNAFGLANTLMQTHFLRPRVKSRKIENIYYCGHMTVPGPGMPTAILSGEIAAKQIIKDNATELK